MQTPTTSSVIEKLRAGERPPMAAMRVGAEPVTLQAEGNGSDAKSLKVNLKARQRGPINHWYWGKVYHDLASVRFRSKIALDDTHDVEVGYGRPVQTEYGLEVDGVVIGNPDMADHPANRILYNLRNGIPQEASIDFGGDYEVTEIPEGMSMTVNGETADGPAIVIQNWPLRACAICKEGADSSTETTTYSTNGSALAPLPRSISTFSQPKEPMSEPILTAPVVEAPAETAPPVASEPPAAEVKPTVEPVQAQPADDSKAQLALKEQEIADLKSRIEALSKPTAQPVIASPRSPQEQKKLNEPATWTEALMKIKADNPWLDAAQIVALTAKKYPNLSKVGTLSKDADANRASIA